MLELALTTFGGAQSHFAHFQKLLVAKRGYLSDEDLVEINSLCQLLPGPGSTQTLTAIGYKIGGPNLAYLTLLVWILPSVIVMTAAGLIMSGIQAKNWSTEFTRFIEPMAVGFVSYGAYQISLKTVFTKTGIAIMVIAALASYFMQTPYALPVILFLSGGVTAFKYKRFEKEEKKPITVQWSNFILWGAVLIAAAILGHITRALPIRLFENFYRNGSLIFGGGQVLIPLLYTEFVEFKKYLTAEEFLSGYAFAQSLPGPVFGFSSFIGTLSMRSNGMAGGIVGGLVSAAGIFLPGTFMIFFVIRFWENLKKYRGIRASLEGLTAASAGLVMASAIILFQPLDNTFTNFAITIATFCLLAFTRIPSPLIIVGGLLLGLAWRWV